MDFNYCSKCGSPAVPGTDRCPNCGSFYDERMNYTSNNNQQYYNNQLPPPPKKQVNTGAVVGIVLAAIFGFVFLFILVPFFIGFTKGVTEHQATLSSEYSNYSEEYEDQDNFYSDEYEDNYSNEPLHKTKEDLLDNIVLLSEAESESTGTDEYGEYYRYIYCNTIYDIYSDCNTKYVTMMRISYDGSTSSWIKDNNLYDSILENQIATVLMGLCDYSWADALDYLDGLSLENGMDETDENGFNFFLDVDSSEISFIVMVPR